jgi:ataxia telangiectasia mutated family protein
MSFRAAMRDLGIVAEISDVMSAHSLEELSEEWRKIAERNSWLKTTRYVQDNLNSSERKG